MHHEREKIMCLPDTFTPRKIRLMRSIGLLCLAASLASQSVSLSFGLPLAPLHFLRGFLIGLGCTLVLCSLFMARRRCVPLETGGPSGSQL